MTGGAEVPAVLAPDRFSGVARDELDRRALALYRDIYAAEPVPGARDAAASA